MSAGYLLKRLGYIAITLFLVSAAVFAITQVLPGNAAVMVLGEFALPEQVAALERQMGLNDPILVQFWRWFSGMIGGDWGQSLLMSRPVFPLVVEALGRSLTLAGLSLALVVVVAIPLGVVAAARRGKATDIVASLVSYLGASIPEFVIATLFLVFLARPELGWFPSGGYVPLAEGLWPFLSHLILPTLTLSIVLTAHIARQTRSEMVDVLQSDYVRTATLKGLPRRAVLIRHALRNAMLPTITIIALDVGYLIGGILVVEEVFAFPGLGRMLIFAIQNRDLPLIQAATLVLAAFYAVANLVADLLYAVLDRRIQYG